MCHLLLEILPHCRISLSLELISLQGNFWHASAQTPWLCVAMFQREVAISWLPSPKEKKKCWRVPLGGNKLMDILWIVYPFSRMQKTAPPNDENNRLYIVRNPNLNLRYVTICILWWEVYPGR